MIPVLMGDSYNPNPNSLSLLPPGCRFFPSDEHLLSIYLTQKHNRRSLIADVIKEIELYDYDPFNLPDSICFRFGRGGRKRHYYCYVAKVSREEEKRRSGGGFWKRIGRVRDVVATGGKVVVGTRKSFVFYLGDLVGGGKGVCRTDWFMHEYALIEPYSASFVLCRVFVKTHRSNRSERPLSCCAEESVTTVRHVGVQHDGTKLVTSESKMLGGLRFPMELVRGLDNKVIGCPLDLQLRSYGHTSARDMIVDPLTAEQMAAILEDDFIELDDLVSPFPGID